MWHRNLSILALLLFCFSMVGLTQQEERISDINTFLDNWHKAAGRADSVAYFNAIADDGIYIGTDKSEVWTKQAFQVWSSPYFKSGKTWNFRGENRHVYFSEDRHFAWFDELVVSPTSEFRGSGVLVHTETGWRIKQYVLSVMVPNDIYREVDSLIKKFETEKLK
jgi:hypothetical protein